MRRFSGALREKVAEGRIDKTQCCIIAVDENPDVEGAPVSPQYENPFAFACAIDGSWSIRRKAASGEARLAEDDAKVRRAANQK
jgi:hypothetical protein